MSNRKLQYPWEGEYDYKPKKKKQGNKRRKQEKKLKRAEEAARRYHPETPEDELTNRKIKRSLRIRQNILRLTEKGVTLSTKSSTDNEDFLRKVAQAIDDPEYKKPVTSKKVKSKKKGISKPRYKDDLIKEIIRPYAQGRIRAYIDRTPTDQFPFSIKEYEKYLRSDYWKEFREKYEISEKSPN